MLNPIPTVKRPCSFTGCLGAPAHTPLVRGGSGVVRHVTFPGGPHDPPLFICRCFPVYRCSVCAHSSVEFSFPNIVRRSPPSVRRVLSSSNRC